MRPRVPADFIWIRERRRIAIVRRGLEGTLGPLLASAAPDPPAGAERLSGGRGGAYRIQLGGDTVVFRWCRRGGWLGGLLRDRYLGLGIRLPRPFVELAMTEEARQRGVPGPEPLGARIDRLWPGWYRGLLVTRYVPATESLWDALQADLDPARRREMARAAGRAIRSLGEAGIYHRDLNLLNCVVRRAAHGVEAFIVDFDRARTVPSHQRADIRARMLRRLERSARKLDPAATVLSAEVLRALQHASEGVL